jgi:methionine synthase I (cobalamin-dependent)
MPNWQFVDIIAPDDLVSEAMGWREKGVRLIGGCCGIGPEHIAALNAAID